MTSFQRIAFGVAVGVAVIYFIASELALLGLLPL